MTALIAALMFLIFFQMWEMNCNLKQIAEEIRLLRKNRDDM